MVELYKVRIPEHINEARFSALLNHLCEQKIVKILKLKRDRDKYRSLIGELLLRFIIMRKIILGNSDIKFTYNSYGKPSLKDQQHIHFNLSHAGDWVVVAFDKNEVGIDIEQIKPIDISSFVTIFTYEEYECLKILPLQQQMQSFYKLWTIKESYVKMIGTGLFTPLNSILVRDNSIVNSGMDEQVSFYHHYNSDDEYIISCSATHNNFPEEINEIEINCLLNNF